MPTYYIDPELGNDSTGVGSLATPWKTITAGATAARTAPGDEIRIKKSGDPVKIGTLSLTNNNASATLATARTVTIDNCESAWSPATNITCNTSNSYYCQGTKAASITPGASFATGCMAWKDLGSAQDYSAYQKISFFLATYYNYAAGALRLDLCSDANGRVPVNSFALTLNNTASGYPQYHSYDYGGALGSNIRSIAIRALSDPGTNVIYIDNIIVTNDITHNTPVGRNDGYWYPVKSIDGAAIVFGAGGSSGGYDCKWKGATSATATGYCHPVFMIGAAETPCVVQESGSAGSEYKYRGGWNFSSATQDGITFYSGQHFDAYTGFTFNAKSYVEAQNFGFVRARYAHYFQNNSAMTNLTLKNSYAAGGGAGRICGTYSQDYDVGDLKLTGNHYWVLPDTMSYGLYVHYAARNFRVTGNIYMHVGSNANSHPLYINGKNFQATGDVILKSSGALAYMMEPGAGTYYFKYIEATSFARGINPSGFCVVEITRLKADAITAGFYFAATYTAKVRIGQLDLVSGSFTATWASTTHAEDQAGIIDRFNANNRWKALLYRGTVSDQVTGGQAEAWAYGGSGTCLYFDPSSTTAPLVHQFYVPVETGKNYKIHMQVKKTSSAANCTMAIDIHGCGASISDEDVALTDSWAEYQSTTFTTDMDGFLIVTLKVLNGSTTGDIGVDQIHLAEV